MSETITPDKFPTNGGWKFRQPQFGNWTNPMAMVGFQASVDAIIAARKQNKALSLKHNLSVERPLVEQELLAYNRKIRGIVETASFFQRSSSRFPSRVVAAAADIKRAAQGTAVVLDWLGKGANPVAQELAEKRAATCVACPKNVPGAWYTEAPAELLKSSVKAWQSLNGSDFSFTTSQSQYLKSCDVCKCLMSLKVWTPLDVILQKTPADVMGEFPKNCWIPKCDQ